MEIPFTRKLNDRYWFTVFTPFILLLLIYLSYSSTIDDTRGVSPLLQNLTPIQSPKPNRNDTMKITSDSDSSCSGRFIYVHNLPSRFNDDLFKNCESLLKWNNMCRDSMNMGLGPPMENPAGRVLSNKSWFATNQFLLEMIFRNRMKQYKCLTNDSTKASAVFVPFYAGLEVGRYLWGGVNTTVRDSASLDLVKWLSEKPEWKALWGRDHFLISGRTAWDFYRTSEEESNWGNKLMFLPESKNMTMLTIESTGWNNNFAIPYPTYFHPTKDIQVLQWQNKMRRHKRPYLFSFVGAPRPNLKGSIRGEIIHQCQTSKKCKLLDCNKGPKNMCLEPGTVMKMFQKSVFCLQPAGDSYTRRSIFDSILAGCIPVFFYPRSAYVQYIWHLPKNHTKYSVYIPVDDIKDGKANIEKILHGFSRMETKALSEEVIRLIPSVIYANPMRSGLETIQDAFDVAVKGVLDRVERIRRDISEGRTSSLVFGMKSSWIEGKYE